MVVPSAIRHLLLQQLHRAHAGAENEKNLLDDMYGGQQ